MKKIVLLLFLSFFCFEHSVFAQTPVWKWAQSGAGNSNNGSLAPRGMGIDAAGNVYAVVAGDPLGGVTFGNINAPYCGMYLVKYNKQGQVKWMYGLNYCSPNALATDAAGNSYITGEFRGTTSIGTTTLTCNGVADIFVAKFDSSGKALWAKRAGGPGVPSLPPPVNTEDAGKAIAVDTAGNCYVGGEFAISNYQTSAHNYVTFDTITYSLPASYNTFKYFAFLAKYNAAGQIQWLRRIEAKNIALAVRDIAISKQGNVFITGALYDTLKFNNLPPVISNGADDVYYAKLDPSGNAIWAKSFGSIDDDHVQGMAVDAQEQCYLSGSFRGTTFLAGNFTLTGSPNRATTFVAKTDSNGNILWASQNTGSGSMGDTDIGIDTAGNAYVSAWYNNTINIGQQTLTANTANGSALVSKWSNTGAPLWAVSTQGLSWVSKIVVDKQTGDGYLGGSFTNSIGFGTHYVTAPGTGFFLAKFSSNPTGISEVFNNELSVYPNPAQNVLYLNIPNAKESIQIQLTDVQGRTLLSRNLQAGNAIKLELPELAKGLYILQAQTGKQVLQKKVVIQ